jgi:hypothetical protein
MFYRFLAGKASLPEEDQKHVFLSRTVLATLASSAALGAAAIAGPIGIGAGVHGGISVGAPVISVPAPRLPTNVPALSGPKPSNAVPQGTKAGVQSSSAINASVAHGRVTSVNGTHVALQLSTGSLQTFDVAPRTAAQMRSYVDKAVAFSMRNGVFTLIGPAKAPLHGTLEYVRGSIAAVKLPDGSTRTYAVTAADGAWLRAHAGTTFAFWTNSGGTMELDNCSCSFGERGSTGATASK